MLGLQVIVCPECRVAVVRRRPELAQMLRRACANLRTGLALTLRGAVIVVAAMAVFGTGQLMLKFDADTPLLDVLRHMLGLADDPDLMRAFRDDFRFVGVAMWLIAGVLGALVCFSMLPHLSRVRVWAVFVAVIAAAALAVAAGNLVPELSRGPLDRVPRTGIRGGLKALASTDQLDAARAVYADDVRHAAGREWRTLTRLGAVAGISLIAGAPLGAILGTRLRRLGVRRVAQRRWRLRGRIRKRRHAG